MNKFRLRYAPSPTGYLHIGNARTALFNYLYTKHYNGDFVIRIEDTDIARNIEGGEQSQLENLKWLGITWDESIDVGGPFAPYNQLARFEEGIYQKYVDQLLEAGDAYKCYCTSEELEEEAQRQKSEGLIPKYNGKCRNLTKEQIEKFESENREYSVRFKVDNTKEYTFDDVVKGSVTFKAKDVSGDFNILKSNKIPTYNFAVVVDDHLMEISHVVRGEDHISNTPKQMMIYEALGFEIPTFAHMTLIVNEEGKKLSKRDTSIIQFIEDYRKLGYLPEAMFNFIALLGWSPEGEEEIFSKDELIKIFDEKRLSKSSAKFDVNKLTFLNNQYMKKMTDEDYLEFTRPYFSEVNNKYDEEHSDKIMLLYKEQISYGKEICELSSLFFKQVELTKEAKEVLNQEHVENLMQIFIKNLNDLEDFNTQTIKDAIKASGKEAEVKGKNLFMPIRVACVGQVHGPDLTSTLEILGKETIINNINNNMANK